jgi:signal transduction histidine kinase
VSGVLTVLALTGWVLALAAAVALRRRAALAADAAHELRGALTAIALAAERMERAGATRAFAGLLSVQLDRMRAGIEDLERAPLRRRRALRTRAARAGEGPARARAGPARLALDSARLAQVVTNLVANAAEHGRGPVEIRLSPTRGGARLEIRNRNRSRELDELVAHRAGGRGRGLGIAGRAARDLGGRLRVETGEEETLATLELPAGGSSLAA